LKREQEFSSVQVLEHDDQDIYALTTDASKEGREREGRSWVEVKEGKRKGK